MLIYFHQKIQCAILGKAPELFAYLWYHNKCQEKIYFDAWRDTILILKKLNKAKEYGDLKEKT